MALCGSCGHELRATVRFCGHCGVQVPAQAPPAVAVVAEGPPAGGGVETAAVATAPQTSSPAQTVSGPGREAADEIASALLTVRPLTPVPAEPDLIVGAIQSSVWRAVREVVPGIHASALAVEFNGTVTPSGAPEMVARVSLSDGAAVEQRFVASGPLDSFDLTIARKDAPALVDDSVRHYLYPVPRKPAAATPPDDLGRVAARVSGQAAPGTTKSTFSPNGTTSSTYRRTSGSQFGTYFRWVYVAGIALIGIGVRLALITEYTTNLITGQTGTSYPDLTIGIVLIVIGVVLMAGAWLVSQGEASR